MRTRLGAILLCTLVASTLVLQAKVVRIQVQSQADVLGGKTFGKAGAHERITGKLFFSADVNNPHNLAIVDLPNAVNAVAGQVQFSADFVVVRPKAAGQGNGTLLFEIPNRGNPQLLPLIDGGDPDLAKDAGDAWLLRQGFTVAALGWQWDAVGPQALHLFAPLAKDHGQTITGYLRGDFMLSQMTDDVPLGHLMGSRIGGSEYPVRAPDDPGNTLTVRDRRDAPRTVIARSQWQFSHRVNGTLVPSDRFLHLEGGFQPGRIYEYVYAVADPVVAGLGFAAVRDFAAYCKHDRSTLCPANRVVGQGISQNGRFLRDFLYEGFNADEDGRIALDGALAHVAGAGRGSFNFRFAQPSRDAQPTSAVFFPTDLFPFTDAPETDPVSHTRAGLLDRAVASHTVPKIFLSNTSYEYWGRAASLLHTTPDGRHDQPPSQTVRIYHWTGLQHFSGPFPPAKGTADMEGQQPESPLPSRYLWRASIANMEAWLRSAQEPPPNAYPTVADATLVPLNRYAFPLLPGVAKPSDVSLAYHLDFGPHWQQTGILSQQPPQVGRPFPVLVPQVDRDGNETDGVRLPELTVPLATYTGWNLRASSIGASEQRLPFEGSYLPSPVTAADRQAQHDPRRSISERYRNREDYLARYAAALDDLIRRHWLLAEDRPALLALGDREWTLATAPPTRSQPK